MTHITPEMMEATYNFLKAMPPFKNRTLPDADDLVFRVTRHKDRFGEFDDKERKDIPAISVSIVHVKDVPSLLEVMAHEIVHLVLFKESHPAWYAHGPAFKLLAKKVCKQFKLNLEAF